MLTKKEIKILKGTNKKDKFKIVKKLNKNINELIKLGLIDICQGIEIQKGRNLNIIDVYNSKIFDNENGYYIQINGLFID